jgi:hypothetical protein
VRSKGGFDQGEVPAVLEEEEKRGDRSDGEVAGIGDRGENGAVNLPEDRAVSPVKPDDTAGATAPPAAAWVAASAIVSFVPL